MPLAWMWFVLINELRIEWTVNEQYNYGWAVPFLCLFLMARKWKTGVRSQESEAGSQMPDAGCQMPGVIFYLLFALCAFLYLPTRLIQEANPDWRLVSWAMALEVLGITLCVLSLERRAWSGERGAGRFQVSAFRFPLLFFLVAVPWPTLLETPIIQVLTRWDVGMTTELIGWLGIPAICHGNVIEVATGVMGIDDACSGIRSFQATLMISLFLGEWLRLTRGRRAALVLAGFLFSLLFNLARLLLLVWVASRDGVAAVHRWHDPAGVTILLGCFSGLWFLAHGLVGKKPEARSQKSEVRSQESEARPSEISAFRVPYSALVLIGWLLLVEIGVEAWYRVREAKLPAPVTWNIAWPTNTAVKDLTITPEVRRILRYDDGQNRQWQTDEFLCQAIFLHWKPGSVAARLTANHTPEVCLAAAGHRITDQSDLLTLTARGLKLPFRFYQLDDLRQPMFVAYCLWEDRARRREFSTGVLNWGSRIAPVLAGQRNSGQRSLEIAINGVSDFAGAQAAVQKLLDEIIVPHAP